MQEKALSGASADIYPDSSFSRYENYILLSILFFFFNYILLSRHIAMDSVKRGIAYSTATPHPTAGNAPELSPKRSLCLQNGLGKIFQRCANLITGY